MLPKTKAAQRIGILLRTGLRYRKVVTSLYSLPVPVAKRITVVSAVIARVTERIGPANAAQANAVLS
ncbi:MAG: hypothetical protein J0I41_04695 [Filimonas sp.]|nr:hypothetical protein [Filimonas sp.]